MFLAERLAGQRESAICYERLITSCLPRILGLPLSSRLEVLPLRLAPLWPALDVFAPRHQTRLYRNSGLDLSTFEICSPHSSAPRFAGVYKIVTRANDTIPRKHQRPCYGAPLPPSLKSALPSSSSNSLSDGDARHYLCSYWSLDHSFSHSGR